MSEDEGGRSCDLCYQYQKEGDTMLALKIGGTTLDYHLQCGEKLKNALQRFYGPTPQNLTGTVS